MAALWLTGCLLRDLDEDGTLVLAVLGDSNSVSFGGPAWPDQLPDLLPSGDVWKGSQSVHEPFEYENFAYPSTGVCNDGSLSGMVQLGQAAAVDADIIIVAFGNLTGMHTAAEYLACHQALRNAASPRKVFIATTHRVCPGWDPEFDPEEHNEVIDATNILIRQNFPANYIIDFDTGFDCATHIFGDGVHLTAEGHALRAERAVQALYP